MTLTFYHLLQHVKSLRLCLTILKPVFIQKDDAKISAKVSRSEVYRWIQSYEVGCNSFKSG